jgi:hypothetical protein
MDDTVAEINKLSKIVNDLQVKKVAKESEISNQEIEYQKMVKELKDKYGIDEDNLSEEIQKTEKELLAKTEEIRSKIDKLLILGNYELLCWN